MPLLLAEGDRDIHRRNQAALAREREIMKGVPGWEVRHRVPVRRLMERDMSKTNVHVFS